MSLSAKIDDFVAPLQFGNRIRDLRRKSGMTLQVLADKAGISVGFLSQVERDKATPSLGTLASIASALSMDVDWFVKTPKADDCVTRAGHRAVFALGDSSLHYEKLTTSLPGGTLTSLIIHVPVGYSSEVVLHPGEESVFVLEGNLRQTLAEAVLDLNTGDSLHFMGETPHSFSNIGTKPARLLWTGTTSRLLENMPERP